MLVGNPNGPHKEDTMNLRSSFRNSFWTALAIHLAVYAAFLVTTIWTYDAYARYMFLFYPIGYLWERLLPWGRDRDLVASAIFIWIPLIGSVTNSLCVSILVRVFKRFAKA